MAQIEDAGAIETMPHAHLLLEALPGDPEGGKGAIAQLSRINQGPLVG